MKIIFDKGRVDLRGRNDGMKIARGRIGGFAAGGLVGRGIVSYDGYSEEPGKVVQRYAYQY